MPKHKLPGRLLKELKTGCVYQTEITFDQFTNNPKLKDIAKPVQQCALIDTKVEEMVNEYKQMPHLFAHKRTITIAYMEHDVDTYYIVDGQHRIEMARQLVDTPQSEYVICIWHMVRNEDDMRDLFSAINIDSVKNQYYINADVFIKVRMDEFVKYFKTKDNGCKHLFAPKSSTSARKLTIEDIKMKLHEDGFFNIETHNGNYADLPQIITRNTLANYIISSANEFYALYGYDEQRLSNDNFAGLWYADELALINEKMVWTLKNTNFFIWLKNKSTERPEHASRYIKSRIPSHTKTAVWNAYYGKEPTVPCPLYHLCNSMLYRDGKNGWQCGHITSEKNGGKIEITNLRPICQGCNRSMGSNNWDDYEKSMN
jgi:hypothetical protein